MQETLINSEEDIKWLFEVHLKDLTIHWKPRSALLIGNEDSPDEIRLYPRQKPLVTDLPLFCILVSDSYVFSADAGQYKEALEIDKEERHKEKCGN